MTSLNENLLKYSCSTIRQGKHLFYSLTMPSDVIARTSIVSRRNENNLEGFQRFLNDRRAQEIADYIDAGGTIPTAVVLSAQSASKARIDRNKTFVFEDIPNAFLVLDGQHRVYGFQKAKTEVRIPVVIYLNLTLTEEVNIFIDLNTKQQPVPNELLLDIKNLALTESDIEARMREVFDYFSTESSSPIFGLTSASEKRKGKISRVTFNLAFKPTMKYFKDRSALEIFEISSSYLSAVIFGFKEAEKEIEITKPIIFSSLLGIFHSIAFIVATKHNGNHSIDHYLEVMKPIFVQLKLSKLKNPGKSSKEFSDLLISFVHNSISI